MTKKEALNLQTKIEEMLFDAFWEISNVSLSIAGDLRVKVGFDSFNFKTKTLDLGYFKFKGDWESFTRKVEAIITILATNEDDVKKLIWSYENRECLTGEYYD